MMKRILVGVVLATTLASLTACGGPSRVRSATNNAALDGDTVVIDGRSLSNRLSRQNEWTERQNGFLLAHVLLRNNNDDQLFLEIRTYFKNEYGAPIESGQELWEPVSVAPYEDLHFQKLCRNKNAVNYQFHVRLAEHNNN